MVAMTKPKLMIGIFCLFLLSWGLLTLNMKWREDRNVRALITRECGRAPYICHSSRNGFLDFASRSWGGPMMSYTYVVYHEKIMSIYYIEKSGCWQRTDYTYVKPNPVPEDTARKLADPPR